MKCNIEYIGKSRQGITKYYCTAHKSFAYDKLGNKLDACLWDNKDIYDNPLDIKSHPIKDIIIRYEDINKSVIPKIIIDNKEFVGVLTYDDCILTYKDFGGIMLARLNHMPLEIVSCHRCGRYHSDNGKFAYTPHSTHLCLYCGHLFHVKEKNVGSELAMIYDIPDIILPEYSIEVSKSLCIEYDMFKGYLLINGQSADKVIIDGKKRDVVDLLNEYLENEF